MTPKSTIDQLKNHVPGKSYGYVVRLLESYELFSNLQTQGNQIGGLQVRPTNQKARYFSECRSESLLVSHHLHA